jgi:hypothetical protein
MGGLPSPAEHTRMLVQSPSVAAHGTGVFRDLPGPPPELEARRQAFRAVMRKLLTTTLPERQPEPDQDREEDDEAA